MRIRSFIIAYALILAIWLFADRRPHPTQQDRYSHLVDLTDGLTAATQNATPAESRTRIIAPGAVIPGTWAAGQIPPERLVAPLVVMDLNPALEGTSEISLDDISLWESRHGMIPQGAVVALRRLDTSDDTSANGVAPLPIARDAAKFLIDARYTIGFAVETPVDVTSDRVLAQQLALRGNYVVESAARFDALPPTGSLVIVAPAKNKKAGEVPVRILAMVR
jgi:kynurenine formamidase